MIYSLAKRTISVTSGTAALEIRAGATNTPRIQSIELQNIAAAAGVFGLGRPATTGTPFISVPPIRTADEFDGSLVGPITSCLVEWGTGPTVPANFFRRTTIGSQIGAGVLWAFPRGLGVPAGQSVVLWNLAANGLVEVSVAVDE